MCLNKSECSPVRGIVPTLAVKRRIWRAKEKLYVLMMDAHLEMGLI